MSHYNSLPADAAATLMDHIPHKEPKMSRFKIVAESYVLLDRGKQVDRGFDSFDEALEALNDMGIEAEERVENAQAELEEAMEEALELQEEYRRLARMVRP
jgi:hypothetical protein